MIFDVEAVFLFPWAANVERDGTFGLIVMLIFIVLLLDGLVYAWKRGLLETGLVDKGRMPALLTKLFNMSRSYSLWLTSGALPAARSRRAPHSARPDTT